MAKFNTINLNNTIYDIGGESGVSSEFISALQELFMGVAVWDSTKVSNPMELIAALSDYAESEDTTGITISYSNGIMRINGVSAISNVAFSNGILALT